MWRVTDLAFVEGGGVHVYFTQPRDGLVEDLAAFSLVCCFHWHVVPVEKDGRPCSFAVRGRPGLEEENVIITGCGAGIAQAAHVASDEKGNAPGSQYFFC